jgi:hypothetical protein
MKPHIEDKLWTKLSELPSRDVDNATASRIRDRSLAVLRGRQPSPGAHWTQRVERFWTDFVELPMTALIIIACSSWLLSEPIRGRLPNHAADHLGQGVELERLGHEGVRAPFNACGTKVDGLRCARHDDRNVDLPPPRRAAARYRRTPTFVRGHLPTHGGS